MSNDETFTNEPSGQNEVVKNYNMSSSRKTLKTKYNK